MRLLKDFSLSRSRTQTAIPIETKLQVPPVQGNLLFRQELIDQLAASKDHKLVVVNGMAGSGKTSLLCQWIEYERRPVAWYALDKTDNEPDTFYRYMIAALDGIDNTVRLELEHWLDEDDQPSGLQLALHIVRCVGALSSPTRFILDDYHFIENREIHNFTAYLCDQLPSNFQMVIASRYSLPFSLSRLRVRNQLTEIKSEQFRFTEQETEQFFSEIIPIKLSHDQIGEISSCTEGWVGGLQLFGLTAKGKATAERLGNVTGMTLVETADYLIDEVIETQPDRLKDFLCRTAFLDRFNAEVCREITGMDDAAFTLRDLFQNKLFLVALDADRTWYRYHHLLSEALRKKVLIESPQTADEAHRLSALWLSRKGLVQEALHHAFLVKDIEFAADLMEDCAPYISARMETATGLRWLAQLPREVLLKRWLLRFVECGLKMDSSLLTEGVASEFLSEMKRNRRAMLRYYTGQKGTTCKDVYLFFESVLPIVVNPTKADMGRLEKTARKVSSSNLHLFFVTRIFLTIGCFFKGDMVRAEANMRQVLASPIFTANPVTQVQCLCFLSLIERMQGRLRKTEAVLQEAFRILEDHGLAQSPLRAGPCIGIASVHFYRNEIEKAREYCMEGIAAAERAGRSDDLREGYQLMAQLKLACGNLREALHHAQMARELSGKLPYMDGFVAFLSFMNGDLATAQQWMERRKLSLEEPFSLTFWLDCLFYSLLLVLQQRHHEALEIFEACRLRCLEHNMLEFSLQADIFLAPLLYQINERDRARSLMEDALGFAEKEGYVQPFLNKPFAAPLLKEIAEDVPANAQSDHFTAILKAYGLEGCGTVQGQGNGNGTHRLTQRELEILQFMRAGNKNKEIAAKAFVSLDTIKTHMKHIFEKLEAGTRVQAVRKAEQLGLFQNS